VFGSSRRRKALRRAVQGMVRTLLSAPAMTCLPSARGSTCALRFATLAAVALAVSACSAGEGASPAAVDADASKALDAGDAAAPLPTFDDLPECDREQPSLACIRALFAPLRGTSAWPFDATRVDGAMGENEFAVATGWDLTAHHVLEQNLTVGTYGCFFGEFRYATGGAPFSGPGCGEMLVAGGHPRALACKDGSVSMSDCVDEVSYEESFDLVVVRAEERGASLDLASALPEVGDAVYVVGNPAFPWLTDQERQSLAEDYPLVSYGKVVRADGRGIVTTAPAVGGNSGGPLLNARGEVLGVLSTLIGHQRARGTSVPSELKDHYAVAAAPDAEARRIVAEARN
jgi:hypothetical protein